MPFMEEGGSNPKMPKSKSFTTSMGPISQEEFNAQIKHMKRLDDLKAEKERSEKKLRKMFNHAILKAQAQKWTEHEAKKVKMMEEYNHLISFRDDPLPITKISYDVNNNKEATMKITRGDNPLNLIVHHNFGLMTLSFSEWLEVIDQEKKLGLPPPPALEISGMTVDGMQRNLIPPPRVVPIDGLVITKPKSGIFFMSRNINVVFQREEEFHLATTIQLIEIHESIKRGTLEADKMFRKLELTIKARDDVAQARDIVKDNLDG
nr:hypothetical protein [Tanacetum cinerariifolium]